MGHKGKRDEMRGGGMMRQEGWRKLIQPVSKNDVGGGIRQNKERNEKRGKREKKDKGPLVVALCGTIWHLSTDAHELNKLSFPFLCQFPRSPPPSARVQPARTLITSQMMEGQRGVEKKSFY